ncbi:MAG: metal-dependent hydrolase [Deltaproteobacteria bacterium]|nr:metal-dependent hydrolase [Deltaproteobacteria bacterium]MBW2136715.1 metal-dependent hydrolase [Deltaproteobacteria bacterium]
MSVQITWYGQATTTIVSQGKVLLIDPWFSGNPVCPVKHKELKHVDIVAVTHGHFDHFGDVLEVCRRFKAKLISTPEIAWYADGKGIPRGTQALPLGYGGKLKVEGFTISMCPALHPSALFGDEWATQKQFIPDGGPASYVVTTPEGKVVYHAGDTALFSDMKIIGDRFHPELGLLPICGRFNMDTTDASVAAEWLRLKFIIPIHYNTNPDLAADPKELVDLLRSKEIAPEVVILNPGDSYVLE